MLDDLGIKVVLEEDVPEMVHYRAEEKRLWWLDWLPDWMFVRKRIQLDRLGLHAELAMINAIMEKGKVDSCP